MERGLGRGPECPLTPPTALPAVYSLDGLLVFGLLLVCTCAYLRKVPRLRTWLLSERRGIWGVCHKGEGHWGHGVWCRGAENTGRGTLGTLGYRMRVLGSLGSGLGQGHWVWEGDTEIWDGGLGSGLGIWGLGWGHRDLVWGFVVWDGDLESGMGGFGV